ncbi:MAG: tRNA pseudouridine(38-40) synthase TruA [Arcobacteraceae bacterium]|jgi:tRNA pseudouridine38-40 synthase|nr:tRNA pseudouridine(38-40) synthase TruA [Arcobacteraceae bacterium]
MIKLTIAYDGSKFNGSAIQPKSTTVQGELEKALKVLGIEGKTVFSGRTDKDVHSTNQVVSFQIPPFWENTKKLKTTLKKLLGDFIQVKKLEVVNDNFHARFSAIKREYRYIVSLKEANPFNHNYIYHHKNINLELLQKASKILEGRYDFAFFSKSGSEPKSTIREIYSVKIYRYRDFIIFKFCANSYLRSQIRMMVAFLLKISDGVLTIEDLQKQLHCEAYISKRLAPPNGLYLSKIRYAK